MRVSLPPAKTFTIGSLSAKTWASPPVDDVGWRLWFYSLGWLTPHAKTAYEARDDRAMETITRQVEAFYRDNPDQGASHRGWDEGSSLRRLETLNCLYIVGRDNRVAAAMQQEANVLFGPRYYGPPKNNAHNHGLMANLALVTAGELIGRRDWVKAAHDRIRNESSLAFTKVGFSNEQSAEYQLVNRNLWQLAAARLGADDPVTPTIHARTKAADSVASWLTEPDGDLVQIGDTSRRLGQAPLASDVKNRILFDGQGGLAVGRWSWSDPMTTYYTVRSGPRAVAHGHHDVGSVTWSTLGTRVLVGPGYYSYDWKDKYALRARYPLAHNRAVPLGGTYDWRAAGRLSSKGSTKDRHAWRTTDSAYGVPHARSVLVDHPGRSLVVTDTYPKGTRLRQHWHLDPEWRLASTRKGVLTFVHPSGRRLTVTSTGRLDSVLRGNTRAPAGWHHPAPGKRVPNEEIRIVGTTSTVTTLRLR